jgi:CBS domain-containing protein
MALPRRRIFDKARFDKTRVTTMPYGAWIGLGVAASALATLLARARRGHGRVGDLMVRDVVTVDTSSTLLDTARRMRDANVGVLPVLERGRLVGMITDRDLVVRAMARGADPAMTLVSECATRELVCARPETDVQEAMTVMSDCQIGRLPVVDDDNHVIGIVTLSSLALRAPREDEALQTAKEVSRRAARA